MNVQRKIIESTKIAEALLHPLKSHVYYVYEEEYAQLLLAVVSEMGGV